MNWESLIIGLGGLIVAILSVYLSYKNRTATFRESLYSKQLDGYGDIFNALLQLDQDLLGLASHIENSPSKKEKWNELLDKAIAQLHILYGLATKNALYVTSRTSDKLGIYFSSVNKVLSLAEIGAKGKKVIKIDFNEVKQASEDVFQAARKDLGTDPLTQETLKLFKKSPIE